MVQSRDRERESERNWQQTCPEEHTWLQRCALRRWRWSGDGLVHPLLLSVDLLLWVGPCHYLMILTFRSHYMSAWKRALRENADANYVDCQCGFVVL